MGELRFRLADGGERTVAVRYAFNAGYAGRDTEQVQAHVDELAELGVPAPSNVPTLYPLSANLADQPATVQVPHGQTSGEAEWALVVDDAGDLLLTAACDHTDRALEVHGVAWSKQSAPDVLGDVAWRLADVEHELDAFTLRAWAGDELIQDGTLAQLLSPRYWADALTKADLLRPGTVVLSGTIPMIAGVDQFAGRWRVEITDPRGVVSTAAYDVERLSPAWD